MPARDIAFPPPEESGPAGPAPAFLCIHTPEPCDDQPVAGLGLDPFEIGVLAILRHLCTSFAAPEAQAWRHAFAIASERWGPRQGPQLVTGLLPVLDALMQSRRAPFRVMHPLSLAARAHATPDEARLLRLLAAMRRDATAAARSELAALTSGHHDPALITAALGFAARHRVPCSAPHRSGPHRIH